MKGDFIEHLLILQDSETVGKQRQMSYLLQEGNLIPDIGTKSHFVTF